MMTSRSRFSVLLLALLMVSALSACGSQRPIQVSASSIVPLDILEDWVTYGDYFAEMTVISERRIEPTAEQKAAGEGVVGRQITVKISDSAWTRPTLREGLSIPQEFDTGGGFWIFKGDKEIETEIDGRPWLAVGESFYVLLAYVDPELHTNPQKPADEIDPQWGPLLYLPVAKGEVPELETNDAEPALAAVSGKNLQEIGQLLEGTRPDPKAADYMDEDPALRAEHVATR